MIWTIYLIILAYFLIGAVSFYFINRRKEKPEARKNWMKFLTYFIIIHILFFSIVLNALVFRVLSVIIILAGFTELFYLFRKSGYHQKRFFLFSVIIFGLLSWGFYFFSGMEMEMILFTFLVLSIFDSFSQITGQLWGHTKLLPRISPQKTVQGLAGGAAVAILGAFLIRDLTGVPGVESMLLAALIVFFAFIGDMAASYFKRRYGVKDFSRIIPGHGGFLDRFDSLIAGGAGTMMLSFFL